MYFTSLTPNDMQPENDIKSTALTIKLSLKLETSSKFKRLHDARIFLRNLNQQAIRIQNLLTIPHFQTMLLLDVLARYDDQEPYLHLTKQMEELKKLTDKKRKELKKDHDEKNKCRQQLLKQQQASAKTTIERSIAILEKRIAANKPALEQAEQEYEAIKEKRRTSRQSLIVKAHEMSRNTGLYNTSLKWINDYLTTITFYDVKDGIKNYNLLEPLKDYLENLFDYEKNDVLFEKYPYSLERNFGKLFFNLRKDNLKEYFTIAVEKDGDSEQTIYYLQVFDCRFKLVPGRNKNRSANQRLKQLFSGIEENGVWYEPRASYISVEHIQNNFHRDYDGNEDRIYLNLVLQENIRLQPVENRTRVMGIDMGINKPLYYSIKENNSEDPLLMKDLGDKEKDTNMRRKTLMRIETLQKEIAVARAVKKNKSIRDLVKKIRGYYENYYHDLSKEIIDLANDHQVGIIKLEKLDFNQQFKSKNFILKHWNFRSLQNKIAYKAARAGALVQWVNPDNTSQTCMHCGKYGVNLKLKFEKPPPSAAQAAFSHNDHVFICANRNWNNTGKTCFGYMDVQKKWKNDEKPCCNKCKQELTKVTICTIDGKPNAILKNTKSNMDQKSKTVYICNNGQCTAKGNWYMPQHRDANAATNIANAAPLPQTEE